jgi:hypothetical protein
MPSTVLECHLASGTSCLTNICAESGELSLLFWRDLPFAVMQSGSWHILTTHLMLWYSAPAYVMGMRWTSVVSQPVGIHFSKFRDPPYEPSMSCTVATCLSSNVMSLQPTCVMCLVKLGKVRTPASPSAESTSQRWSLSTTTALPFTLTSLINGSSGCAFAYDDHVFKITVKQSQQCVCIWTVYSILTVSLHHSSKLETIWFSWIPLVPYKVSLFVCLTTHSQLRLSAKYLTFMASLATRLQKLPPKR